MTDMALTFMTDGTGRQWSDLAIQNADVAMDDGLETAVLLSLDLNARNAAGLGGFWGDHINPTTITGSLLWTLARSKTTRNVLREAEDYAEAALQWLIDEGIARRVKAHAQRGAQNQLKLSIGITQRNGRLYETVWTAQRQVSHA